jgi:putative ABC transport system permease protein
MRTIERQKYEMLVRVRDFGEAHKDLFPESSFARDHFTAVDAAYADLFWTSAVGPGFFEAFDRPIVAGRAFHDGDRSPSARTVIVNEAFVREFSRDGGRGSPIGARLRYSASSDRPDASAAEPWFEIVGVVRDVGLDPDDLGDERPYVFHAASADTVSPLVMSVRVRGNPATLAARLPVIAADVDASLLVEEARSMEDWIRQRDVSLIAAVAAQAAVTALGLFLSALSIFSLVSVSVSRRTREIGLRAALGAHPRHVLAGIMSRGIVLMGSGITAGGVVLLLVVAENGSTQDVALYARYLAATSAVMLAACLLACIGPARRAFRINPTDALREA